MARPLKLALVQMRSTISMAKNGDDMDALVREAASAGARYIQTPEMTGLVEANRKGLFASAVSQDKDPIVQRAAALAKELSVTLHIGSTPILLDEGRVANRAFLFGPEGALLGTYDKLHMFDVDLDNGESWRESAVYRPGDDAKVLNTAFGGLGLGICYDVRFPELFAQQALNGAELITTPAAFTKQTGAAHWHVLLRARAIETGCFLASAAQGGRHEDGRETYGHSMIISPWGEVIAELAHDKPAILVAEIDLDDVKKARGKIPNLKHRRSFEIEGMPA